jgi:hypothetical protein
MSEYELHKPEPLPMEGGKVKERALLKVQKYYGAVTAATKPKESEDVVAKWRRLMANPNLRKTYTVDKSVVFRAHLSDKQKGATKIFDEIVVQPLKELFPEYKGVWGDCTACFAEQASQQWGHNQPDKASFLAFMFYATERLFAKSGQRQPAVLRENKTSSQANGSQSVYDHCVQKALHGFSQVWTADCTSYYKTRYFMTPRVIRLVIYCTRIIIRL